MTEAQKLAKATLSPGSFLENVSHFNEASLIRITREIVMIAKCTLISLNELELSPEKPPLSNFGYFRCLASSCIGLTVSCGQASSGEVSQDGFLVMMAGCPEFLPPLATLGKRRTGGASP